MKSHDIHTSINSKKSVLSRDPYYCYFNKVRMSRNKAIIKQTIYQQYLKSNYRFWDKMLMYGLEPYKYIGTFSKSPFDFN